MRTPRPGPGKGWRKTISRGRPSATPSSADLVLEELAQRLEQLQVQRLGQPAHVVVRLDGDRLLGLGAGRSRSRRDRSCPARATSPFGQLLRLALEHLDEQPADDLALLLGVARRPSSPRRTRRRAFTRSTFTPRCFAKVSITWSPSSRRSSPVSTKTQVSWSPMALWMSAAATAESTPPDRPRITSSLPTCSRMCSIACGDELRHVPVGPAPQISCTKRV